MKTLIPLSDFVLEQEIRMSSPEIFKSKVYAYANFLKQPLKLEMFIPCINDEPISSVPYYADGVEKINEYKAAKEKVLFEDAVIIDDSPHYQTERILIDLKLNNSSTIRIYSHFIYHNGREEKVFMPSFKEIPTVEFLVAWNLTLTPSALNKIGIKE